MKSIHVVTARIYACYTDFKIFLKEKNWANQNKLKENRYVKSKEQQCKETNKNKHKASKQTSKQTKTRAKQKTLSNHAKLQLKCNSTRTGRPGGEREREKHYTRTKNLCSYLLLQSVIANLPCLFFCSVMAWIFWLTCKVVLGYLLSRFLEKCSEQRCPSSLPVIKTWRCLSSSAGFQSVKESTTNFHPLVCQRINHKLSSISLSSVTSSGPQYLAKGFPLESLTSLTQDVCAFLRTLCFRQHS